MPHAELRSLKGDRAFQRLRKGHGGGARLLGLRWEPRKHGQVRVGIVVSRKVGNAVVRNRVRRRLREALRSLLDSDFPPAALYRGVASFDLLVIARPEASEASYAQLHSSLRRAMERSKLL
jgi:ribonuclease P protein component